MLNRNFVCAYINNEEYYRKEGSAPPEERAELQRIHREGNEKKLDIGMVRAFILTPDGHPHEILPSRNTLPRLERAVEHFKPTPGKPVVPPAPQSRPPSVTLDAVILHLIARGDDRGSWGQFPAENWIVLERADWSKLLPAGDVTPGQTWELDRDVTMRILTYFYPQTENNNTRTDRIQQQLLTAKVLTLKDGMVTARIDGFLRMQHVFYPGRNDAQPLGAEIAGVLTFSTGQPPSLQLATTQAQHGQRPFTVAVRTVPTPAR